MSLNWREIDCILDELSLPGSFVQRILQPDFSSLVLSIYRPGDPFDLYISLATGKTRIHRLSAALKSPKTLQRFAQLLRSRVKGGRILEAYQVGSDRIVKLLLVAAGTPTVLWIRLWGGAANIIATDDAGVILDAFYRRPGRGEVSGGSFDPEAADLPPRANTGKRYEIRELPGTGSFNARVEAFYREGTPRSDLEALRVDALAAIERRETRLLSTLDNLKKRQNRHEDFERLRQLGDLVMSNLAQIHEGASRISVVDYYNENAPVEIELDSTLSPELNGESYYERYKKAKSGWEKLRNEIAELESSLAKVREERQRALGSTSVEGLRRVTGTAAHPAQGGKTRTPPPGLQFESGGHHILVGRSARENDELLRRHVRGNDLWLHTRDYPGAYVFVKSVPGKSVPLEVLLDAGTLALYYSKARAGGQAELYYTQAKYLRRPKEGKKGLVLPTQERNLTIRHDQQRIDRLFRRREEAEIGR